MPETDLQSIPPELPQPQSIPPEILKQKNAINFYFIAEGAVALVVIVVPILSRFGEPIPPEVWAGWNICIGGLIAVIGGQSKS